MWTALAAPAVWIVAGAVNALRVANREEAIRRLDLAQEWPIDMAAVLAVGFLALGD